jgi:hypothetical protein
MRHAFSRGACAGRTLLSAFDVDPGVGPDFDREAEFVLDPDLASNLLLFRPKGGICFFTHNWHQSMLGDLETSNNVHLWKKRPQPGIKPVIAGDTTYGVYLLTGTMDGSNVALP